MPLTVEPIAKSLQSCLTLCDHTDGSPSGSSVPGILQARTLGWVAISFSNAWKWKVKVKSLSRVRLLATLWTTAHQSMGFSRQEYWNGVPLPSPCRTKHSTKFLLRPLGGSTIPTRTSLADDLWEFPSSLHILPQRIKSWRTKPATHFTLKKNEISLSLSH